jgi:DNA-binding GntR family transcriptional regulator
MPGVAEGVPTPLVRRTSNRLCELVAGLDAGQPLPAEAALAGRLSVSRTTVRLALDRLSQRRLIRRDGGRWLALRDVADSDLFPETSLPEAPGERFDSFFLQQVSEGRLLPGGRFSELELARQAKVSTVLVREVLARYAQLGVIAKEPRRRWEIVAFDVSRVHELWELRRVLEKRVLEHVLRKPRDHPVFDRLRRLEREHQEIAGRRRPRASTFSRLDDRFHRTLFEASENRYFQEQYLRISLVIHFQLKDDDIGARGMELALVEHRRILAALRRRDRRGARLALARHLDSSERIMGEAVKRMRGTMNGGSP